jgi:hypothetical protein
LTRYPGFFAATAAFLVLLTAQWAAADDEVYRDAGAAACAFLKMDVGARAAALAGTGILNGNRLAVFGNPALLASSDPSVTIGHNQWFGTTTQNYVAGVFRLGSFVTSTAFRILHTGDLEYREEATGEPVDTFSAWNLSLSLAAGLRLGIFDLGAGVKLLREKVWTEDSDAFAFDAGVVVHPLESLELACAFQNVGPMVRMVEKSYRLPLTWRFGARYTRELPLGSISVTGEVSKAIDYTPRSSAALEYSPVDWAALRGGYRFGDESQGLTAGAGLRAGGWTLDYAFVPGRYALGTAHRFTLSRSI